MLKDRSCEIGHRTFVLGARRHGGNFDALRMRCGADENQRENIGREREQSCHGASSIPGFQGEWLMNPTYDFKGQVALVTGAGSGMGLATARAFADAGAAVALVDRNAEQLGIATQALRSAGKRAIDIVCDVSDETQARAAVARVVAEYGRLDMAYNNAGILGPMCEMSEETGEGYDLTQAVNLRGIWTFMKHELLQMKQQGSGGALVVQSGRESDRRCGTACGRWIRRSLSG
jgi:hypothetical protein